MPYEKWQEHYDEALAKFRPVGYEKLDGVTVAEASAGTGSRYCVIVSALGPDGSRILGGSKLVSVMHPWKAVYPVNSTADGLHETYLMEKFMGSVKAADRHGGDVAAMIETIRYAVRAFDGEYEVEER